MSISSHHLLEKYRKEIRPALRAKFGYRHQLSVPRLGKAVINTGVGKYLKDEKMQERVIRDLALLSGQKAIPTTAKKSIAGFKIRQGATVGFKVTLRGRRMYDFLERLINIALPRLRDFRGLKVKNIDRQGTLNIGLPEQSIFPEIQYESLKDLFGLQIAVVTTAKKPEEALELLKLLGFPFRSEHN